METLGPMSAAAGLKGLATSHGEVVGTVMTEGKPTPGVFLVGASFHR